eukprot:227615-Pelagomonas_calceolata.AAC.6
MACIRCPNDSANRTSMVPAHIRGFALWYRTTGVNEVPLWLCKQDKRGASTLKRRCYGMEALE